MSVTISQCGGEWRHHVAEGGVNCYTCPKITKKGTRGDLSLRMDSSAVIADTVVMDFSAGTVIMDIGGKHNHTQRLPEGRNYMCEWVVEKAVRTLLAPPPHGAPCGVPADLRRPVNGRYSHDQCQQECQLEEATRRAGCRKFEVDPTGAQPECRTRTLVDQFDATYADAGPGCGARCPQLPCDYLIIHRKPKRLGRPCFSNIYGKQNEVKLWLGEVADYTQVDFSPVYTLDSLLAELGGTMGLFVGISLISVLHCAEFIFTEVVTLVCCVPRRVFGWQKVRHNVHNIAQRHRRTSRDVSRMAVWVEAARAADRGLRKK